MTVIASRGMKASGATKAEASTASPMVVRRGEISALRTASSSLETAFHCLPSEDVSAFRLASSSDSSLNSFSIVISSRRASWRSRVSRMKSAWTSVRPKRAIRTALGWSSSRTMRITSSRFRKTMRRPSSRCSRFSTRAIRHCDRRFSTSRR